MPGNTFTSNYGGRRSNRGFRRPYRQEPKYNKNHDIRSQEVRLIDNDGTNLGVVDIRKAMSIAKDQDLDLVEFAPKANPPVCRVVSWSKFIYEQKKKEKEARKNKQKEMKEFRFGTFIAAGDRDRQLARATGFLDKGHNVKLTITRKGRTPIDQSKNLLKDLLTRLSGYSTIDPNPTIEGRRVSIIMKGLSDSQIAKNKKEAKENKDTKKKNAKAKDKKDSSKKVQDNKTSGGKGKDSAVQQKSAGTSKDKKASKDKK